MKLLNEVKIPDPVEVKTEDWLKVGYGTLEDPMVEIMPTEIPTECVLDLVALVFDFVLGLE
jgi:hypothetical protein